MENLRCVMEKICAIENHPNDSRVKMDYSGTIQTLTGRMGTGGGNVPLVLCYSKQRRAKHKDDYETWVESNSYNQTTSLEVAEPLRSAEGGDTKPKVLITKMEKQITLIQIHYRNDIRIYEDGISTTVAAAYGLGGGTIPIVIYERKETDNTNGKKIL